MKKLFIVSLVACNNNTGIPVRIYKLECSTREQADYHSKMLVNDLSNIDKEYRKQYNSDPVITYEIRLEYAVKRINSNQL